MLGIPAAPASDERAGNRVEAALCPEGHVHPAPCTGRLDAITAVA